MNILRSSCEMLTCSSLGVKNQDALRFITRNSDRKNLTPLLLAPTEREE
jgi:hypothetical protein